MSEYSNYGDAQRLISTESSSRTSLVSAIRKTLLVWLLFDEIEKAHPDVFDLLLQILEQAVSQMTKGIPSISAVP